MEVQISQLAQEKAERTTRTFGCNTEKNPKEESKAVLTRSQKRAQEEGEVEEDQSEEGRTNRDEEKEEEGAKRAVNGSAVPVIEDFEEDEMKEVCLYLSVCALMTSYFLQLIGSNLVNSRPF